MILYTKQELFSMNNAKVHMALDDLVQISAYKFFIEVIDEASLIIIYFTGLKQIVFKYQYQNIWAFRVWYYLLKLNVFFKLTYPMIILVIIRSII